MNTQSRRELEDKFGEVFRSAVIDLLDEYVASQKPQITKEYEQEKMNRIRVKSLEKIRIKSAQTQAKRQKWLDKTLHHQTTNPTKEIEG